MSKWTADELDKIGAADELEIAAQRARLVAALDGERGRARRDPAPRRPLIQAPPGWHALAAPG
jgi:hypothetical protein